LNSARRKAAENELKGTTTVAAKNELVFDTSQMESSNIEEEKEGATVETMKKKLTPTMKRGKCLGKRSANLKKKRPLPSKNLSKGLHPANPGNAN
jgi:hypothetical protein